MSRWIRAPGAVTFIVLAAAAAAVEPASAASSVEFLTAAAEPADAITVDGLPGSVELPLDGTLVVASPYAGRVASILVDEGDRVAAGEVLATVVSSDWADERARLVRLAAELGVARQQAARDATLAAEGVVASSRAAASAAARRGLEAELAALRAVAGRWTPAPGEAAGFALTAPRAGVVVTRQISTGGALDALAPAFVLASGTAWRLEVRVPIALAATLPEAARLRVGDIEAQVTGRGLTLDPHTQTVMVRARLPEDSGLVPGQQVTATLAVPAPPGAVAVPRAALVRRGESVHVFVAADDDFRAVHVTLLGESGGRAVVTGELSVGAAVVVTGTSALKSRLDD